MQSVQTVTKLRQSTRRLAESAHRFACSPDTTLVQQDNAAHNRADDLPNFNTHLGDCREGETARASDCFHHSDARRHSSRRKLVAR